MPIIDMATVLSQVPHVQNVAGAQQSIPAAQQAATTQAVQHAFDIERSKVQKAEETQKIDAVDKDREKDKERRQQHGGKRYAASEPDQAVTTTASNASPWAGNLIDVKI